MRPTPEDADIHDALLGSTDILVDSKSVLNDDEVLVAGRLQVMVIGTSTFATVALPGTGTFELGRSRECPVRIEDVSISRRHAALHIGAEIQIEDLGSANGTRVRNQALAAGERVTIALGEIVNVGKTTIVVQQRSSMLRPRRVWTHDDFEARLGEECARAERNQVPLAVLRIETSGAPAQAVQEILSELLRQSDVVGADGFDVHEVLLPDTRRIDADDVTQRIRGRLTERKIDHRISSAHFPQEGRSAHSLIARLGHGGGGNHVEVVVRDPVMISLHSLAKRIAVSSIGALILGETGVGKDVFAERVHQSSPRGAKSFLQLNCAGLTETMLDSELFGHEKGAFTGAVAAKEGLLETADGGTVFLDEIGDMPAATQAKLLRVIEDGQVRRVGGLKSRTIDVRFIAATNRDLEAEVAAGTFRRDLYFRLNGVTIVIPPLRDRVIEIEPLARLFAARAAAQAHVAVPTISGEALELMRAYAWPGNVRELKNMMARAVILSTDGQIGLSALPADNMRATILTRTTAEGALGRRLPSGTGSRTDARPESPADAPPAPELSRRPRPGPEEADWIRRALDVAGGNQTRAAQLLGISRNTLISRLVKYGFERPRKGGDDDDDPS